MQEKYMDENLIRWRNNFLFERTIEIVLEGKAMVRQPVEAGVPQGSPVSPILFAMYTAGRIAKGERVGAEGLSVVDDIGWIATGRDVNEVVTKLGACAAESLKLTDGRGLTFETANTDAAYFTRKQGHKKHLRPKLTGMIRVGNDLVRFNREATRWLGV
jgi:hypothetical protein